MDLFPPVVRIAVGLFEEEHKGWRFGQVLLDPVGPDEFQVSNPLSSHPLLVVDALLTFNYLPNLFFEVGIGHLQDNA